MYSVIEISGGIGKNIMATAIIDGIKNKHPERKILVISAYPQVFLNNPNIYRVFKSGCCQYIYSDYIKDNDVLFFCNEPYRSHGYIAQNKHLIDSWADDLGVECKKEPKLYLTSHEINMFLQKINVNKPILLFQPFGGASDSKFNYSWNRDIPPKQAQQLVDFLSTYYHIVQPISGNTIKLNNCDNVTLDLYELFSLVLISDKILGIDSCVQHATKALGKKATVCWITNKPEVFGYDTNINILPDKNNYKDNINDTLDSLLLEYDFTGSRFYDYPFKTDDIFNLNDIINTIQ